MTFPESQHAHQFLDGLEGLEIGGSAHNPFGLNTRNVDYTGDMTTVFKQEEVRVCGRAMPVDIVAEGDDLPLDNGSVDFVVSSHVIEHFFDPIGALQEWARVARRYVYVIVPYRDALEADREKPITPLYELIERHDAAKLVYDGPRDPDDGGHWTRWTPETFVWMVEHALAQPIVAFLSPDDKVGNGFAVVIDLAPNSDEPERDD